MKIDKEWSPELAFKQAIQKQIEREDMIGWAETPAPQIARVRKIVVHKEKLCHAFPLKVWKYIAP